MKKVQYAVIATFVSIIILLCAFSFFPDRDGFSAFENRRLSNRPLFSFSSFFNGKYADWYETYLLDNFLLRDLSVMGYQSYTDLFFLDAFSKSEDVLMSIDVDDFVTAQKTENTGEEQQTGYSPSLPAGQQASVVQQPSAVPQQTASHQPDAEQQAPEQVKVSEYLPNVAAQPQTTEQPDTRQEMSEGQLTGELDQSSAVSGTAAEQEEKRLNNSLIIFEDRVMMPTGSSNLKVYGSLLAEIAEVLPGKKLYSVTGPTSATFYASSKYTTGSYDQSNAESIIAAAANGVKVVGAYEKLLSYKEENIYFRSDVHWTALGAYYAYAAFCETAGLLPASLEEDFTKDTYEPFLGGLYSQIYKQPQATRLKNNPEQLDYYIPKIGHQLTLYKMGNLKASYQVDSIINTNFESLGAYKYSCFAWGDQRIEKIDSNSTEGRKVLVVKDSYGSAFVPFLVPNYSMIYVIDPKGFNQEGSLSFDAKKLIKDEEIDDVIFCFSIYGSGRKIIRDSLSDLFLK